eukprot:CAMPEP_0177212544 /NCGR_PEP_ID=MMETSP0367-20130122/32694_1 /TAXON_ID=447022 ORGANISM="Scrippsiella hangoei-like, Strain SHHI-4" /NCGR_SAMPLE_ID=MMETSP0367 /ASSEMBLY_ACC=CAM_ASM_000362 /LENGTH=271 /DNA_ID=CAMNT_0018661827 /DNA_START=230 /DNA_END=1044 /DNA_ORIENTATION=+
MNNGYQPNEAELYNGTQSSPDRQDTVQSMASSVWHLIPRKNNDIGAKLLFNQVLTLGGFTNAAKTTPGSRVTPSAAQRQQARRGIRATSSLSAAADLACATEPLALAVANIVSAHAVATFRRPHSRATGGGQLRPGPHATPPRAHPDAADRVALTTIANGQDAEAQTVDPKGTLHGLVAPRRLRTTEARVVTGVDGATQMVLGALGLRVAAARRGEGRGGEPREVQQQSQHTAADGTTNEPNPIAAGHPPDFWGGADNTTQRIPRATAELE